MELEDIEYFFVPSIRLYKRTKYLFRCYVNQPRHIKKPYSLQIYDENENNLTFDDIGKDQKLISILEVLGIKYTQQSFHIEYCLRQIMIINEKPMFDKCLINLKKNKGKNAEVESKNIVTKECATIKGGDEEPDAIEELANDEEPDADEEPNLVKELEAAEESSAVVEDDADKENEKEEKSDSVEELIVDDETEKTSSSNTLKKEEIDNIGNILNIEDISGTLQSKSLEETETPLSKFKESLKIEHLEKNGDIKEIILTDMDETNPMKLKKPTEVYYEIYKKAREKAKQAKKNAIKAYLEAKRIKNTFLLDEVMSSDESDNDCTINFNT